MKAFQISNCATVAGYLSSNGANLKGVPIVVCLWVFYHVKQVVNKPHYIWDMSRKL